MIDPENPSFHHPERGADLDEAQAVGRAAQILAEMLQKGSDQPPHRDGELPIEHLFGHVLETSELVVLTQFSPAQREHFLYLIWPLFLARPHRGMKSFMDAARLQAIMTHPAAGLRRLGITSHSLASIAELLQDEWVAARQALRDTLEADMESLQCLEPLHIAQVYSDVPIPQRGAPAYDRAVRALHTIFGDSLHETQLHTLLEMPVDGPRRHYFLEGFERLYAADSSHASGSFASIQRLYLEGALRGIDLQKTGKLLGEATLDIERRVLAPRTDLVVLLFANSLRWQPTVAETPPENCDDPVDQVPIGEKRPLMSPENVSEKQLFLDVVSIVFYKDMPYQLGHQVKVLYTYLMVAHGQIPAADEPDLREMKMAIEDLWDLLQRARPEYSDEIMNRVRLFESLLQQPRTAIDNHIRQRIDADHPPSQRHKIFKQAMEQVDRHILACLKEVVKYTHAMRDGREWPGGI